MSYTSNVPACTLTTTGFVAPSEQAILTGELADLSAAFSSQGSLNTGLSTPQGQLASSITAIIGDGNNQFLALANGVDPATATGRMQDAIGYIYFLERLPATPTTVPVLCYGANNVVIPAGVALASDGTYQYANSSAVTISASGSVSASFTNTLPGPFPCASNSLTISQLISGWDSITNSAGVAGSYVETAQAFELRRQQSVEVNSVNTNQAVFGAVLSAGATTAYVVDNPTSGTLVVGGVTLTANSLYVAALGGTSANIATAIWNKKPPGCNYQSGTNTVTVVDSNPAYNGSGPSYSVTYTVPSAVTINMAISIKNSSAVPSNAQAQIQTVYGESFAGLDGQPPVSQIGKEVFAARFYDSITALGAWAQNITALNVGTGTPSTPYQAININQYPALGTVALTLV